MRPKRLVQLILGLVGVVAVLVPTTAATAASGAESDDMVKYKGKTTASYFWDDGSGRNGDTGEPASGEPMQKGLAASPSWPLMTQGYVIYKGQKMPFFVGDRGPGDPSGEGIMLDLDAKSFAKLTGGDFNSDTLVVDGNGGMGHIDVKYVITKWGDGDGKRGEPQTFDSGWWDRYDDSPAKPVPLHPNKPEKEQADEATTANGKAGSKDSETAAADQTAELLQLKAMFDVMTEQAAGKNTANLANAALDQPAPISAGVAAAVAFVMIGGGVVVALGWRRRHRLSQSSDGSE